MAEKQLPEALQSGFEAKLGESLRELNSIWDDIGIVEELRKERINVVFYHLHDLLKEMLQEEKAMRNKMLERVDRYGEELIIITKELNADVFKPTECITTLQLEKELRTQVETLNKIKHERLKQLKRSKSLEQELCDSLCMTPHYIPSGTVPTEDQLRELHQHIVMLTKEQDKRRAIYRTTKKVIVDLMHELEREASTTLEKELSYEDETVFILSMDNLHKMAALQKELEGIHKSNFTVAGELRDRLDILWTRLEVPDEDRTSFTSHHQGFKPSVISAIRGKIAECEKLKLLHIEKFVAGVREELLSWWDRCYIPQSQREEFLFYKQEDLDEDLLDAHDQEVKTLKMYYQAHSNLFQKLSKRQNMFSIYCGLDAKANDPNRFNNRGGNLLMEEKQRKKLLKDLPKLEQEVCDLVSEWEKDKGRDFLLDGTKCSDYIEMEWDNLKYQKENEKMERQKKQVELMEKEMIYGSKPVTPAKKRFTSTPSKTPNKFRKIQTPTNTTRTPGSTLSRTALANSQMSHTSSSTMGHSGAPVPATSTLPPRSGSTTSTRSNTTNRTPKVTPRRLRETNERRKSFQRRILSEKNNGGSSVGVTNPTANPAQSFSQTIITRSHNSTSPKSGGVANTTSGPMKRTRRGDMSSLAPPGTEFTYREFVNGISTDARSSILVIPPHAKEVHV